jgi:hypothetical protein
MRIQPARKVSRKMVTEADTCRMVIVPKLHSSRWDKDIERKPFSPPPLEEQRRLVAYLHGLQAQVSQLRRYQEETQQELDALMPSILDKAFKGEL